MLTGRALQVALPRGLPLLDPCFFAAGNGRGAGDADGAGAGGARARAPRFMYFRRLMEFLLGLSGVEVCERAGVVSVGGTAVSDDDVAGGAAVLVEACRGLGVGGDVAAVRLKTGTGEAVVGLLDALVDHALRRSGTARLKAPDFGDAAEEEVAEEGLLSGEDAGEWWRTGGGDRSGDESAGAGAGAGGGLCKEALAALRAEARSVREAGGSGWRGRVAARAAEVAAHAQGAREAGEGLRRVRGAVETELEAVRARERLLEERARAGGLGAELRAAAEGLAGATAAHAAAQEACAEAEAGHAAVGEALAAQREEMERCEAALHDASGLDRMRRAVKARPSPSTLEFIRPRLRVPARAPRRLSSRAAGPGAAGGGGGARPPHGRRFARAAHAPCRAGRPQGAESRARTRHGRDAGAGAGVLRVLRVRRVRGLGRRVAPESWALRV